METINTPKGLPRNREDITPTTQEELAKGMFEKGASAFAGDLYFKYPIIIGDQQEIPSFLLTQAPYASHCLEVIEHLGIAVLRIEERHPNPTVLYGVAQNKFPLEFQARDIIELSQKDNGNSEKNHELLTGWNTYLESLGTPDEETIQYVARIIDEDKRDPNYLLF